MKIYVVTYGECCGSTDRAHLIGVYDSKRKANKVIKDAKKDDYYLTLTIIDLNNTFDVDVHRLV